ncbi:DUF6044 family protein [Virgibacillus sp. 179-BFC.A HS]|uniref:DUF6044 family protein n=1 Tax=Tigheibacillus jepli TaxID=3035914 RepID=A0ABU5CEC1_9BACI|nr:DUF6044 family protein [Virgibacillus sp. 179-BFC.A HS]MDY0404351.1 DUF6044 family protein [Virgibacillus sp. 179-BFC.A HS]
MYAKPLWHFIKQHSWTIIALIVIGMYVSPYYILGEDAHIRVHDNMDSNIVWYKLLAQSGQIFTLTDVTLPNVIDGLPRSTLPSALDAMVWLYALFPPMVAYAIGQTIMRLSAFFGMKWLLEKDILHKYNVPILTTGTALCFAILPFWPSGMLSIAGLPLALHLFLIIRRQRKDAPMAVWVLLLLIPFFSSFILTFIFFLGLLGVWWLVDWIRTKKANWPFFAAIAAMTAIYLVKNYLLITSMFLGDGQVSHRDEYNLGHKDAIGTFFLFLHNFFKGHTHDLSIHEEIIIPVIALALMVAFFCRKIPKLLIGLLLLTALLSAWYALWYWEGMRVLKDHVGLANTFNFSRIHFLDPPIWYVMLALAMVLLWQRVKLLRPILIALLVAQCFGLFLMNEEHKYASFQNPTFRQFYATDLFADIKDYIGKDPASYRVVSVGMHPTIAQYNGFYTLDTYNNSFPLSYKHQFRKIIADELDKSKLLKSYFDDWGGRLYIYSSELGKHYMIGKKARR